MHVLKINYFLSLTPLIRFLVMPLFRENFEEFRIAQNRGSFSAFARYLT